MTTQLSVEEFCAKYEGIVKNCLESCCKRSPTGYRHSDQLYSEGMLTLVELAKSSVKGIEEGYIAMAIRYVFNDYIRINANIFGVTRNIKSQPAAVHSLHINEETRVEEDFFAEFDNRDEILNGCCADEEQQAVMDLKLADHSTEEISEELNITRTRTFRLISAIHDTCQRRIQRGIV